MPSRRIRRTDGVSREKKMWAAQRKPGMGGILPFGAGVRGNATTVLGRPGGGGQGQASTERVVLHAVEGQTITNGGETAQWFRRGAPPTEQVGFAKLAEALDGGPVTDIPIDVTGDLEITLDGRWGDYPDGFKGSGDLVITRTRVGSTATKTWKLSPAARTLDGVTIAWDVRAGDFLSVTLPNDSGEDQTLAELEIGLRIIAQSSSTSNVPLPFPTGSIKVYLAADNAAELYIDGAPVVSISDNAGDTTVTEVIDLEAGVTHHVAVKGTNTPGVGANPAMVRVAIYELIEGSESFLYETNLSDWDCQDYPGADPAGWPDVGASGQTWTAVFDQTTAGLGGASFPSPTATRIWSRADSSVQPVGSSYFRGSFST